MATLEIEGHEVEVDDAFLSLTPEQQGREVEEIANQIGIKPNQASPTPAPDAPHPSGKHLSFEEGEAMLDAETGTGQAMAGASGYVNGTPILGPALTSLGEKAAAGLSTGLYGGTYDDHMKSIQMRDKALQDVNPGTYMAGQVAGAVVPMVAAGTTATGARMLGMGAGQSLPARIVASGLSNAAISAADTAARGGDKYETGRSGLVSGAIGTAFPILGAGVRAATSAIGSKVAPVLNALSSPGFEASRRVGTALARDAQANPGSLLTQADEATARSSNIPLMNVDRGGEGTRALARSASNQSSDARALFNNAASDRFASQSHRAANFVQKLVNNSADDIGYRAQVEATAKAANDPAYKAAFSHPNAQMVFTKEIQNLMQSPSFRSAIEDVPTRSADRGAVQGFKALGNPFQKNSNGSWVLRKRADGSLVGPNLEFWNQVKINLDEMIGDAKNKTRASDLMGLKRALVNNLDSAVPEYKAARSGAAAFFGQENAIDAGKAFAKNPKGIPEAAKAMTKFSPAEREAFAVGHASELVDMIRASKDRMNVINSVFGSEASRMQMKMVYGATKAKEIEAYVKVETLVDQLRGAMGNSTTARQLAEMGLGAGSGYALTGDWKGGVVGALAARGGRFAVDKAQADVLERVAKLLTSDNPAHIRAAIQAAAKSPLYMQALDKIGGVIEAPARGLAIAGQR
jgi:hypothetical protein